MAVRTRTTTTTYTRCRSDVMPQLQPFMNKESIKWWRQIDLPQYRLGNYWRDITLTTKNNHNRVGTRKSYQNLRMWFTMAFYFLIAITTIVLIVSLGIAVNQDPYSRGNISFHDQTMQARVSQEKTLHRYLQSKQSKVSIESSSLPNESVQHQPPTLSFGDSMVAPSSNDKKDSSRSPPIKFFWGIMSTLSEEDKIRRSVIRQTYLNYYQQSKASYTPHRICSLTAYRSNTVPRDECEMIYAFVVGGDPADNSPKDLVDEAPERLPLELNPPSDAEENDLVYLNIHENAFEGKMQSYFKWVTNLIADNTLSVDYIAKVDSDTILFPSRWFSFVESSLLPSPYNRRVYGGIILDRIECGGLRKWHCRQMVNFNYMSGELYFLSADLAEFIVSDRLGAENRRINEYFTEDMTIGNFVHSYSDGPIHQVVITEKYALWEHGDQLKDPRDYVRRWEEVKGTWRLDPSFLGNTDTTMEDHDGTGNIIASYEQFSADRWTIRAIINEFYLVVVKYVPSRWNLP